MLPAGLLNEIWLNWYVPKFGATVAAWAKRYQVVEAVCLFVVIVFAAHIAKRLKWHHMVDIHLAPQLFLADTAMATLVAIALTRAARLAFPVWAIIYPAVCSPLPIKAVLASVRFRHPFIFAWATAKMVLSVLFAANSTWQHLYHFATPITGLFNRRNPHGVVFASVDFGFLGPFRKVLVTTEVALIPFQSRLRVLPEFHAAPVALYGKLLYPPGVILSFLVFTLPRTFAGAITKLALCNLEPIGVSLKNFTATIAGYLHFGFSGRHLSHLTKQPLGVARTCYRTGCQRAAKALSQYSIEQASAHPVAMPIVAQMS